MIDDFRGPRPKKPAKRFLTPKPPAKENKPADEPAFQTPEQVAAKEPDLSLPLELPEAPARGAKKPWYKRLKPRFSWPPTKLEYLSGLAILIVLAGGIWAFHALHHSKPPAFHKATKIVKKAVQPTTVPSTLSGLPVDPSVNQRPVTGVMIENSIDARPQSGLGQASVVFEAVAEGGVTRFLALFQDTQPDNIGPIRSARPYYIQWALGFDAGYAHVGGSPDGLQDIKDWGVRDLDQFYNSGAYHRTSDRQAPHNVYSSITALNQLEAAKGYTSSNFTGFVRKKEAKPKQPTVTSIDFAISGPTYNPHYDYNATTNTYSRSEAGSPHVDANSNAQIAPKVVIALIVPKSQGALDSSGAYYSEYAAIGSGTAYIFQDGAVTTATWQKAGNTSQITFTDSSGKTVGLDPGQTWLTALGDSSQATYH